MTIEITENQPVIEREPLRAAPAAAARMPA